METVKRIIEWLSHEEEEKPSNSDEILFEIGTIEDAARIAMGSN